tara:strand:+ start:91052 stop:91225 length:174 start_codon:yes stop_codon:yes gene_type:complete
LLNRFDGDSQEGNLDHQQVIFVRFVVASGDSADLFSSGDYLNIRLATIGRSLLAAGR